MCAHPGNIGPLCLIFSLILCVCRWLFFLLPYKLAVDKEEERSAKAQGEDRFLFDPRPQRPTLPFPCGGDGEQLRPHNEGVDNNTKTEGLGTVFSLLSLLYSHSLWLCLILSFLFFSLLFFFLFSLFSSTTTVMVASRFINSFQSSGYRSFSRQQPDLSLTLSIHIEI